MKYAKNGNTLEIKIEGKLDRLSSPDFEKEVADYLSDDVRTINIDLKDCIYISSAGLRVILALQKKMTKVEGKMTIRNVPELVKEVFTETGLDEILTLE